MANKFHKDLVVTDGIHVPYSFSYANEAARTGASGFVAGDIGKFALQEDNNSIWVLTSTTPTWEAVSSVDSDVNVKVTSNDTTTDYLDSKISLVAGKLSSTILNPSGDETLQLTIGADVFDKTSDDLDDVVDGTTYGKVLQTNLTSNEVDHTKILNKGTNTHANIDTHIALTNEHIDWTNATQNFYTTGNAKIGHSFATSYTLSIQTNTTQTWLEILNSGGFNQGVFFGIWNNDFELYNWQGGPIHFYTHPSVSNGLLRMAIKNDGTVQIHTLGAGVMQTDASGNISSSAYLSNVTDDAQLKREAGDFATFSTKATPVSADILLIEDSADSNNKKKITVGNLPSVGGLSSFWVFDDGSLILNDSGGFMLKDD